MNENVVPEFKITRTLAVHTADVVGAAQVVAFFAEVNVNFRARTTWTGFSHLPEIFFTPEEEHMFGVKVWLFLPDIRGFIILRDVAFVVTEAGSVEFVFGQAPHFGEQLPRPSNGFFFVIVTK